MANKLEEKADWIGKRVVELCKHIASEDEQNDLSNSESVRKELIEHLQWQIGDNET